MEKTTRMYDYICETPSVLRGIIANREEITKAFIEKYQDKKIEQVYIIGSGTSYHSGVAAKAFLEEVLNRPVYLAYPIPFKDLTKIYNKNTLVIGISQGGQSYSTVYGLDAARAQGLMTAAISQNPTARVFEHADVSVDLAVGEELCGAKTKGYAGTVCTLMMLGLELALAQGTITKEAGGTYLDRMETTIANLPHVTEEATKWYDRIHEEVLPTKRILVTGYDANYANVLEGSLKMLETIRQAVSGYELEEFLHGIYNSVNQDSYIFYLGSKSQYKARALRLKNTLAALTSHHFFIGSPEGVDAPTEKDLICSFVDDPLFSVWEYIIPLQVVAAMAPIALGINPDIPADPQFHQKMGSK